MLDGIPLLDRWFTARETGDTTGETAAAAAFATSHDWPILVEIDPQGATTEQPSVFLL